jgi:hypothetical protein
MNLSSIYAYLDGNDEDLQKVMAGSADRSPEKQGPQDLEILGGSLVAGLDLNKRPLGYEGNIIRDWYQASPIDLYRF